MQYLVQVNGETSDKQSKTYVIDANSEESAQIIATQSFCDEFSVNGEEVCVKPHKRMSKAIAAFAFMLIPILLSLINWKNGHDTVSISPDYISCLYGVLIYTAFVVRFKGIQRTVGSWIDILFCVFLVLLLATFVKAILVTKTISIFGISKATVNTQVLVPIVIILSWLGLKIVSLSCMAGIILTALFKISSLNEAMGSIFGSTYIICSFVGVMLYLSVEPAVSETMFHFKKAASKGLNFISNDISLAKSKVVNIKSAISKKDND